jgi:hypothetical protein
MFVTYEGTFSANPFAGTTTPYVMLSAATLSDTLVLAEFSEEPYQRRLEGFDRSDGRSLAGALRIKGNSAPPTWKIDCNFVISENQLLLFEQILAAQTAAEIVTITDYFSTTPVVSPAWIDVDNRYATRWAYYPAPEYLLQFVVMEGV